MVVLVLVLDLLLLLLLRLRLIVAERHSVYARVEALGSVKAEESDEQHAQGGLQRGRLQSVALAHRGGHDRQAVCRSISSRTSEENKAPA